MSAGQFVMVILEEKRMKMVNLFYSQKSISIAVHLCMHKHDNWFQQQ